MASKGMFFAVVFGLLACAASMVVISAGDLPTAVNPCSEGPSYWCQSIGNAKSCRATKHCIQSVWEKHVVPEDNDSICEVCKEMVKEARDQLLSNETQEDMKQVFEGSCKLMPIKMVQLKCIKLVDDFIPELIEMLASQMNPTMVCTTALLCNNAWVDGLLSEYKGAKKESPVEQLSNGRDCESCKAFMSHSAMKVKSSSQVDLQNVLFNICSQMNSYSDACMGLVSQNIEHIFNSLEQSLQKDDLCQPLGFCDETQSKVRVSVRPMSNDKKFESRFEKSSKKVSDDLECQFCEALVKNVRVMLISNTTEAEFIQVLNGLCKQTGTFAKECQALVEQYGDVAYSFFLKELDPHETCRLLTLCSASIGSPKLSKLPSSYLRIQPDDIEASKLIPAQPAGNEANKDFLVGQDERNAIRTNNLAGLQALPAERLLPASISVLGPRKPGCMLCEYVLHEIINDLKNATIKEEIETTVKNICHKLPSSISKECDNLINNYGDAIFFLLSQELDPNTLCTQLQLCAETVLEDIKLPANPFKAPTYGDANTCALCEFVIKMLDDKLEDNRTEESIKTALEGVCQHLPKTVRSDCVRLVDAYSKEIIEMLLADLKPDEVCVALKLCSPKTSSEIAVIDEAPKGITVGEFLDKIKQDVPAEPKQIKSTNTPQCVMCEYAMSILEKRILTNSTEEQITRAIQFLCSHLPSTVSDMCIDFVEQYGDELFELLSSEIAPEAVCTQMGLCLGEKKTPKLLGHRNEKETALEVTGWKLPSKCEICEIVIEYLDKLLADDTIEASIDHIIENACTIVPRGAKDKCVGIVDTYGPYLLSQLATLLDNKKVCQSVHLCKPPPGQVQLLGGKQCTWGPSYWCASPQHAGACNALEHCQTKVWMKSQP